MIKRFAASLCATALSLALAPALARAATDEFEVGNWYGGAYYDESGKEFLYCAMDAPYESGHTLIFAISADGTFAISLSHEDWTLGLGESYPVEVLVDGKSLGQHTAEVVNEQMIWVPLDYSAELVDWLRKGRELAVVTRQDTFYFALTNTFEALNRLERCVDMSLAAQYGKTNPFGEMDTGRQNPFSEQGGPGSQTPAPASDQDEVEIVKSLLFLAGLDNFEYVAPSSRDDMFSDADHSWTDGETTGAMYIFNDTQDMPVTDVASAFFQVMRDFCDGTFSFGTQDTDLAPGFPAERAAARCQYPDGGTVVLPAIIWRDGDEITVIAHASDASVTSGASEADEKMFQVIKTIYQEP